MLDGMGIVLMVDSVRVMLVVLLLVVEDLVRMVEILVRVLVLVEEEQVDIQMVQ